jgi:sugar lactone lactonase YvrE
VAKGYPDGSAVDRDGYLWNARWDGWCITRFAPDGTLDRIIDLPVQRPTCCAFGGPELKTLYITTAIGDLTEVALRSQPWAGGLLAIDVDVPGLPRASYRE